MRFGILIRKWQMPQKKYYANERGKTEQYIGFEQKEN